MTEHPIYEEAISLMNLHSLIEGGWRFELSMHKTFLGMCYYDTKTIAYSSHFLNAPSETITNVVLHEIAHALVGPGEGHSEVWKAVARQIGCTGDRCLITTSSNVFPVVRNGNATDYGNPCNGLLALSVEKRYPSSNTERNQYDP